MTSNPYRLPRAVHPVRYDLVLEPDLERATFPGTVDIALDVDEATDELVVQRGRARPRPRPPSPSTAPRPPSPGRSTRARAGHVRARLGPARGDRARPLVGLHGHAQRQAPRLLPLHLQRRRRERAGHRHHPDAGHRLPPGLPVLGRARLQGRLRRHARRRPTTCWPSPTGPRSAGSARPTTARCVVRFADTMPMSTYLVAFVVGPLEATEPGRRRRRAAARRPRARQGPPRRLRPRDRRRSPCAGSSDYYGIPYPADKVDLVALPDFAVGAMENLGCITFRESVLLVDPADGHADRGAARRRRRSPTSWPTCGSATSSR